MFFTSGFFIVKYTADIRKESRKNYILLLFNIYYVVTAINISCARHRYRRMACYHL